MLEILALAAAVTLAATPSTFPVPSTDPDLPPPSPEDLEAIEEQLRRDAEDGPPAPAPAIGPRQLAGLMNPDLSVTFDAAASAFSQPDPLMTGAHDPVKSGFNWQQLELGVESAVDPYFMFKSFIVFAPFGVEVEEAYAQTLDLPHNLQARAGQFLTRFGRINATHPHSWDFADQTLVIGKMMGGEGNRGLGVELSWMAPLPWYVEAVGSVTDAAGGATARSFFGGTDLGVRSPLDLQATAALKQFFPLGRDWSLLWGLSAANGPNASGRANRTDLYGTDLYLKWRPLEAGAQHGLAITLEAIGRRRQLPGTVLADAGGYASAVWHFDRNWDAGIRVDSVGGVPGDPLDPDWTGPRHRGEASVTYRPTEFSRLRLQAGADSPAWRREPIYSLFLTLETTVGAHGAHAF